jgi:assimilatory nitrate reductase catalytic subunit
MVWHDFAYRWLAGDAQLAERLDGQSYRVASFIDGQLDGCLSVGPANGAAPAPALTAADAADGGIAIAQIADNTLGVTEPVICACFGVAVDAVRKIVACGTARTVADIGRTTRAGTNCGSCLPELKRMIVHERVTHPE